MRFDESDVSTKLKHNVNWEINNHLTGSVYWISSEFIPLHCRWKGIMFTFPDKDVMNQSKHNEKRKLSLSLSLPFIVSPVLQVDIVFLVVLCTHACFRGTYCHWIVHPLCFHEWMHIFTVSCDETCVLVDSAEEIISSHSSNLKAATAAHLSVSSACVSICVWMWLGASLCPSFYFPSCRLKALWDRRASFSLSFKAALDNPF